AAHQCHAGRHELRRPASGTSTVRARTEPESALLRKQALREAGYHWLGAGSLSLRSVGGRCSAEAAIRSLLREEQFSVPRSGYSLANCAGCFVWQGRALGAKVTLPWQVPLPRRRPAGAGDESQFRNNWVPVGRRDETVVLGWCARGDIHRGRL